MMIEKSSAMAMQPVEKTRKQYWPMLPARFIRWPLPWSCAPCRAEACGPETPSHAPRAGMDRHRMEWLSGHLAPSKMDVPDEWRILVSWPRFLMQRRQKGAGRKGRCDKPATTESTWWLSWKGATKERIN